MAINLNSKFIPTHRHAEGGLYEVLDFPRIKYNGEWVGGVLYRNEENVLCVRTQENFNERFSRSW